MLFLGRYLAKAPIALSRLELLEHVLDPTIRVHKQTNDIHEFRDFSPLEFLAELQCHVPDIWEQTTRFFGVYSARTRGAKRRHEQFKQLLNNNLEPLALASDSKVRPVSKLPASKYWAICIKRIFEVNPLECPKCHGQMQIKSFILNHREITKLMAHCGMSPWRAPPAPAHAPTSREHYIEYCH